jgi:hypothetical protein
MVSSTSCLDESSLVMSADDTSEKATERAPSEECPEEVRRFSTLMEASGELAGKNLRW